MAFKSDRRELGKLCSAKDWSKAIRILDKIVEESCSVQDICNRALCYSQLELHKHVVRDCDKALQIDSNFIQAYILKGQALLALGRKEESTYVWEQGYEKVVNQAADLKKLLELEELLASMKQKNEHSNQNVEDSLPSACDLACHFNSMLGPSISDTIPAERSSKSFSSSFKPLSIGTSAPLLNGSPKISGESNKKSETDLKSGCLSELCNILNDSTFFSEKIYINDHPGSKTVSLDFRLSHGISLVNAGNFESAISMFTQILKEDPMSPEALIGRGTGFAFQRKIDLAIIDFTKAIEVNSLAVEAWKRRGQARAALGEFIEAVQDLTKALELEPNSSDILHERAVDDLSSCISLEKHSIYAYAYLGLSLSAVGEYDKAEEAYHNAVHIDETFLEGWVNFAQFYQDLGNSKMALQCLKQALHFDRSFVKAYHLRGLLLHGAGQHRNAINDLSAALTVEGSNIECLYLRASCYHAVGEYKNAVKDYDAVLDLELDSLGKFVLQCLSFYQKEIALYTASRVSSEFIHFDIDGDIDPLFKEYWCKRLHPKHVSERVFRQTPLSESLNKGRLSKLDRIITKQTNMLLQAADLIGHKIQYNCAGFLSNRRQHRMAGLAAIEIAQKVSKIWRSLRRSQPKENGKRTRKEKIILSGGPSQNRGGACSSSSTNRSGESAPTHAFSDDSSALPGFLSWRGVYSIAVKWRQISEPCDPVVWIDKLSEEFNSGFGSHTPMLLGQAKVVRYYPNYHRVFEILKSVVQETECVFNAEDEVIHLSEQCLQKIKQAKFCSEVYDAVGESFWVATTCEGTAVAGKRLEGTRITVQKMDTTGIDFAIRTPSTPSRWAEYETEMKVAWQAICSVYTGEAYGSADPTALEPLQDAILTMAYYWYNFMALSRGTAAVGYVVVLGLLLAANMEVAEPIPEGVQVDWEAILASRPHDFVASVKPWLYPAVKVNASCKDLPDVASTFPTTGSVVAALSSYARD
ncbi:tetratricopeptide repeat (TPR)-like superfamily protein isoform X2 [Wolffia australiana]